MRIFVLIVFAFLGGFITIQVMAEPIDRMMIHDGELVHAHIDYTDNPCQVHGIRAGCYAIIKASHHVWFSSLAPGEVINHELAHVSGMRHTEWEYGYKGASAIVTVAGPGYPLGAMIFDNGFREFVF